MKLKCACCGDEFTMIHPMDRFCSKECWNNYESMCGDCTEPKEVDEK